MTFHLQPQNNGHNSINCILWEKRKRGIVSLFESTDPKFGVKNFLWNMWKEGIVPLSLLYNGLRGYTDRAETGVMMLPLQIKASLLNQMLM